MPGRPAALLSAAAPAAAAADGPACVPGSVDGCGQNCTASEKVAPPPNESRDAAPMTCKCEKLRGPKSGPMSRVPSGRLTLGSRSLAPPSQRFHFSRSGAPSIRYEPSNCCSPASRTPFLIWHEPSGRWYTHQYPMRSLPSVFDESGLDVASALTSLASRERCHMEISEM